MITRTLRALALAVICTAVLAPPAQSQFNSSLLRTQAKVTERTVARNLAGIFKPRLVVSKGATGPVMALALSGDERLLVTAAGNKTLRVWDLWAGREVARLAGHQAKITAVAVAHDGSHAVSVAEDRRVKVWNLKQLGEVVELAEHDAPVTDVVLSETGDRLFTGSADGRVRVWSMPAGRLEREFTAHQAGLLRLAAVADGKMLVTGGADGRVRTWEAESGRKLLDLDADDKVIALALQRDGALIAAGTDDGDVHIWKADGSPAHDLSASTRVTSVAFAPPADGRLLIGDGDGGVHVWDIASGDQAASLGKHEAGVSFVAVNGDGGMGLSGSEDGTTRLWNLRNQQPLVTLISTEAGWAVVDAKGRYDGSQTALEGIDWKAEDVSANIDDFAETHYQAALLPRSLAGEEIAEARSIPDGARYPATVRIVSSAAADASGKLMVEVVAEDNGGGVSELRLYRNGKALSRAGSAVREERDGKARLVGRFEVDLVAGRPNILAATAFNDDRLESRPEQVVVQAPGQHTVGKLHLLIVGINTYAQTELNLDYARPDAQAIANFLATSGKVPMPLGEVVILEDQQATRDNILAALRNLRSVPAEDTAMLYMAGHGVSVGDDWYFISHEVRIPSRIEDLAGLALSSAELKAEMEGLSADRTLLLLDTCHSGTAATPLSDYRGMKSLRLLARSVGTHVLAATDKNQFAVELDALGHGIFTYTVLAGLQGEASRPGESRVTATDLIRFVEEKVPVLSQKFANYAQYPTGYSRGSDFAVAVSASR